MPLALNSFTLSNVLHNILIIGPCGCYLEVGIFQDAHLLITVVLGVGTVFTLVVNVLSLFSDWTNWFVMMFMLFLDGISYFWSLYISQWKSEPEPIKTWPLQLVRMCSFSVQDCDVMGGSGGSVHVGI